MQFCTRVCELGLNDSCEGAVGNIRLAFGINQKQLEANGSLSAVRIFPTPSFAHPGIGDDVCASGLFCQDSKCTSLYPPDLDFFNYT